MLPDIRKNIKIITICTVLKLIVLPAIVTTICYMLGFRGIELFILFSLYATPLANAIFPMSRNRSGRGPGLVPCLYQYDMRMISNIQFTYDVKRLK